MNRKRLRFVRALFPVLFLGVLAVPVGTALADDNGGGEGGDGGRRPLSIYEMQPSQLGPADAAAIAGKLGLTPVGGGAAPGTAGGPLAFQDANGHVRMLFGDGSVKIFPDLTKPPNPNRLPGREGALRMALDFLKGQGGMQGGMGKLRVGEIVTLTEQPAQMGQTPGPTGGPQLPAVQTGQAMDVLRTVEFVRTLDGLDVFGPTSILSLDVGMGGVNGGEINLRPIGKPGPKMDIISQSDATTQFLTEFPYPVTIGKGGDDDEEGKGEDGGRSGTTMGAAAAGGLQGTLQSTRRIYYEQGGQYLQPAYLFRVLITGPLGTAAGMDWLVPAVQRTPEPIINHPFKEGPSPLLAEPTTILPFLACERPSDIKYGRYILRDDDQGWLVDTQGFGANIDAANSFLRFWVPTIPPVNNFQYYWNYPWLWQPSGSPATDQSPYFPGSVNMALIEGHGAPWLITTEKNCCDVIYLPQITGFGGYHNPAEITDYVIWQSCDVIPAPGDPYGGAYSSPASPFDVWFNMFQGMRGTYGYHTTMNIWNGVGKAFGTDLGFGAQNLSAWFTECNNNVFHHGGGWNYGSAVLISGHEGDTLYDTCPLPPPGSLTIWWQHS